MKDTRKKFLSAFEAQSLHIYRNVEKVSNTGLDEA